MHKAIETGQRPVELGSTLRHKRAIQGWFPANVVKHHLANGFEVTPAFESDQSIDSG
jgi:hypothetical protein